MFFVKQMVLLLAKIFKQMKIKKSALVVLLISTQLVSAQTVDNKFAIGLNLLKNEYNGEYGSAIWNFDQSHYGGGLSLGLYLNRSFDLGLQGTFGKYGYIKDGNNRFDGNKLDASLFGHYKLNNGYILNESSKLSPFISFGLGFASYYTDNNAIPWPTIITDKPDFIVPVGVGLKYQITNSFAIQYQYLYNFTSSDVHDQNRSGGVVNTVFGTPNQPALKSGNDTYGQHLLGIVFSLNGIKDADGDGIADNKDKCPNTPKGVKVDAFGCPIDTDGDGVADYLDKCPDTPAGAAVDASGCPLDSDGDGVPDYLDKCPNTPAGVAVDAKGCPIDTDGDGVPDYLDKCPNTPAGVAVDAKGCPIDTDGDGVADYLDKCPGTPKGVKVDANGCPLDRDGDGVPDYLDKCPDVPGIADNKGCPEIKAETKKIFAQALQGIQFESGKDVIKKTSNGILDKVVSVMKDNPSYELEINGHTDNQGDAAKNMILSQKRSDAVKEYLVSKGISASRLTAKVFGQTIPVADNKTAAGKSKNRRVEFKVNF